MNTFLPSTIFEQSAKWLDTRRLGKQRVECLQILKAITDPNYGWQSHPAVNMWRGYSYQLTRYGLAICEQWVDRGYRDNCGNKILDLHTTYFPDYPNTSRPPWLTEEFASNHRSILLGKAMEQAYLPIVGLDDLQSERDNHIIGTTEEIELTKEINKRWRKGNKGDKVLGWYLSHNWTETPAKRVDGKWPYLWPLPSPIP